MNNFEPDFLISETSSVTESWFSAPSTTATGASKKGKRLIKRMKPRKQISISGHQEPEEESMWEKERNVWADLGETEELKFISRTKSIGAPTETEIIEEEEEGEVNNDMNLDDFDIQPAGQDPNSILDSFLNINPTENAVPLPPPSQDTFVVAPIIKNLKALDESLLNNNQDGLPSIADLLNRPSNAQLKELQLSKDLDDAEGLLRELNLRYQNEDSRKKPVTKKDLIEAKLQVDQLDRLKPLPKLTPLSDNQLEQKPSKIASFLKSYFNQEQKPSIARNDETQLLEAAPIAENGAINESTAMETDEVEASNQKEEPKIFGKGGVSHISLSNFSDFESPLKLPQRQQTLKTPEKPLKFNNYSPSATTNSNSSKKPPTPLKKYFKIPKEVVENENNQFDLEIVDNPTPLEVVNFEIEKRSFYKTKEFEKSSLKMSISSKANVTPQKPKNLRELNKSLINQMKENTSKEENYDDINYSGDDDDDDDEEDYDMDIDENDNKSQKSDNGKVNEDATVIAENVDDMQGLMNYINGQPAEEQTTSKVTKSKKKEYNPFLDDEAEVETSDDGTSSLKKMDKLFGEAILDDDKKNFKHSDDDESEDDQDRQQKQLDRVMIDNRDIQDNTEAIMKLHNKLIQDDEDKNFLAFAQKAGLDDITDEDGNDSESLGSEDSDEDRGDENNSDTDAFIIEDEGDNYFARQSQNQKYTQFANITIEEELEHRNRISVKTSNLSDDFESIRKSLLPSIGLSSSQSLKHQRSNILEDYLIDDDIEFANTEDLEINEKLIIEESNNFTEIFSNQNSRTSISHVKYKEYLEKRSKNPTANKLKSNIDSSYVSTKSKPTTFIVRSKEDITEDKFEFNVLKKFKKQ